jgi:hypothetical protein
MEGLLLLEIHSLALSSFFRYDTALMINILTKWFNAALMVCLSIRPAKRSNVARRHGSALSLDIPLIPFHKSCLFRECSNIISILQMAAAHNRSNI